MNRNEIVATEQTVAKHPKLGTSANSSSTTSQRSVAPLRLEDLSESTSKVDDSISEDERDFLLSGIESIGHECDGEAECEACLFRRYQRLCVAALQGELRISNIADVVTLLGVFIPFRATALMKSVFKRETLEALSGSDGDCPKL